MRGNCLPKPHSSHRGVNAREIQPSESVGVHRHVGNSGECADQRVTQDTSYGKVRASKNQVLIGERRKVRLGPGQRLKGLYSSKEPGARAVFRLWLLLM